MTDLYQKMGNGFEPAPAPVVMQTAEQLADAEIKRRGPELSPDALKPLVRAFLAGRDHEFCCIAFLDARFRLIEFKITGEGDTTQVSPNIREIVRAALTNGAVGCIFIHNHPGGIAKPSSPDKVAAVAIYAALAIFRVRLLDCWVTAGTTIFSFEEEGVDFTGEKDPPRGVPDGILALIKALGGDK